MHHFWLNLGHLSDRWPELPVFHCMQNDGCLQLDWEANICLYFVLFLFNDMLHLVIYSTF